MAQAAQGGPAWETQGGGHASIYSADMSQRTMDPVAVEARLRRLLRRQRQAPGGPWLHAEVARRMGEWLALIKLQPASILEWWGGLGVSDEVLRAAYPAARRTVVEPGPDWAALLRQQRQPPWWSARRWSAADAVVTTQDPLPPGGHQLVWANMVLQSAIDPPALFARWHEALAVGGFVMFSCLGPDTLKQLRALYAALGWAPPGVDFIDMHDLGDMLLQAGFADPVMDQEVLTLTWATPAALLDELRSLGGNVSPQRPPGLRGAGWRRALEAALERLRGADGRLALGFEVAYGHAFKVAPRLPVGAATTISLDEMRAQVRAAARPGGTPTGLR